MQSFRTELENNIVEKDIIDLEQKIRLFKEGKINSEKFRSLRLARGVYGQRQPGVQMIRIKIPFGRLTTAQLKRIADVSDEYSNGHLHLTTRQDIQIHHVSLDRTPQLWAELEKDDITLREACGNTVRNVTASAEAGILPDEIFDVSPYAHAVFAYFLRKPFGQELGRKIKIAFSSNEKDTAFTFIHDFGFIPKIKFENGIEVRGFKVVVGGGLGAQPYLAQTAFEFLHEDKLIPFIETGLRVFDRYGERNNRNKARLKYLIQKIGLTEFLHLIKEEEKSLLNKEYYINRNAIKTIAPDEKAVYTTLRNHNQEDFEIWKATNTFRQKQENYFGVYIKIQLGNLNTKTARRIAEIVSRYAANDIRITINQNFLLRFVPEKALLSVYQELKAIGLDQPGYDSVADITTCPGTDTCNLAISNSTNVSTELEKVIYNEFPHLIYERDIKIKISGCMNSCGQHGLAHIGFHGSSFKFGNSVVPALQLLLGGSALGNGEGRSGDKIIKFASKRAPEVIRTLLRDFENQSENGEPFLSYYLRKGKDYFYQLLKPLGDSSNIKNEELLDWGSEEKFKTEIGIGECAGVVIDLVATLLFEAEEKLQWAESALEENQWADAIYHTYAAILSAAKSYLLTNNKHCNTHYGVISDFDTFIAENEKIKIPVATFREFILQIKSKAPSQEFALNYYLQATEFIQQVKNLSINEQKHLTTKN